MIRIVTPFKPFVPESKPHHALGAFDWLGAIEMQRHTALKSCGVESVVITDLESDVPGPALRYATTQTRLMLWILEVALRYIESDDFDRDTVMVSPDILIMSDLAKWFDGTEFDIGLLTRPRKKPRIMNSVQFWRVDGKERLIEFYRSALENGMSLRDKEITWGADTTALVNLVKPVAASGVFYRHGAAVRMIEVTQVLRSPAWWDRQIARGLEPGDFLIDFKYLSKLIMRSFFLEKLK